MSDFHHEAFLSSLNTSAIEYRVESYLKGKKDLGFKSKLFGIRFGEKYQIKVYLAISDSITNDILKIG